MKYQKEFNCIENGSNEILKRIEAHLKSKYFIKDNIKPSSEEEKKIDKTFGWILYWYESWESKKNVVLALCVSV